MAQVDRPFFDFLEEIFEGDTLFWDSSSTPLFTRKYEFSLNPATLVTDLATQLFGGDENYATAFLLCLPEDAELFFKIEEAIRYRVSIKGYHKHIDRYFKFKHANEDTECTVFVGYIHFTRYENIDGKSFESYLLNWKPWKGGELPAQIPVWIHYQESARTQISDDFIDHLYSQKVCSIVDKNERMLRFNQFKATEIKAVTSVPPMKTFNILLLGQTGVGKSTFINALANYLTYESFDKALSGEPVCLIPINFSFLTGDYDEICIKIGKSPNEADAPTLSFTKNPRVYQLKGPNQVINVIDVPGAGNTKGLPTDKENQMKIIEVLKLFKKIHGIFIMLRAGDSKLTAQYKYCMSEMLVNLHRNALENLFFVFTNSRGFDYSTGNAHEPLKAYLQELKANKGIHIPMNRETFYCIDNDGYRCHCACSQHTAFRNDNLDNHKESWNRSRDQVKRILARVATRKPYAVSDTLSINVARSIIVMLLEPLASITNLLRNNVTDNMDNLINDLQNPLTVSGFDDEVHIDSNQRKVRKLSRINEKLANLKVIDSAAAEKELKNIFTDLKLEQEIITKTMVDFGLFLKTHCFLEYNNDYEERLRLEIRKEKAIAGRDEICDERLLKTLKDLRNTLDGFLRMKHAFDVVVDTSQENDRAIDANMIVELRNALFLLPLHGEKFQETYNKLTKSTCDRYSETEFVTCKVGITL